jgi:Bacterial Ig-like domain (group 3)/von Willebrand factor type D domain
MRKNTFLSLSSRQLVCATLVGLSCGLLFSGSAAQAQITSSPDVNTSKMANYQNECSIIKNPTNHQELFASCNNATGGLFAARSTNLGVTWTYADPVDMTVADGDPSQGPSACCDPTLAWDTFGNLYLGYIDAAAANIIVLLSTDGGINFTTIGTFAGSVDQPTVVAANTTDPSAPVALWVVWNQSGSMRARGAAVTGLGAVGAFNPLQTIPGTSGCSFGDVAIAPSGVVVQACQNPTSGQGPGTIRVNIDADGLGAGNFGATIAATTTNVGGFDFIPAQNVRSVDSEAGLAFDSFAGSPHFGRLYLVYTEETVNENNDTDIMVRSSDDNGATWSAATRVNDDPAAPVRSQFLPRIATNPLSGNVGICWHDARNSAGNNSMQEFCTLSTPSTFPVFLANGQIGDVLTSNNGSNPPMPGQANIQYGDYSGMSYFQGRIHPIWADTSNSTGDNPDGATRFDAYTDRVLGGAMAMEGDPHIVTVDGVHYDFQGGGEYTVMLDSDGTEIQARHTPISTTFTVGPNGHTGLTTCVSLTTAVAARVGSHRVTYQPNLSGVPDPSGLQLRVDGILITLGPSGMDLGDGARVNKTAAAGGIEVEFANGTHMIVTPGWWASQSKWYLNVNISRTLALEGIMGDVVDGWLPRLPNGTSLGPRPAALSDRYVDLYKTLGDAWRVTTVSSLFDYAPGTSTKTFTYAGWPPETAPCVVPKQPVLDKLLDIKKAQEICAIVRDERRRENCTFDVMVTSDPDFARTYQLTETLLAGATVTTVSADKNPTRPGETPTFTAVVERKVPAREAGAPAGIVQFFFDEAEVARGEGGPRGHASWTPRSLETGTHRITVTYTPDERSGLLPSSSGEVTHTVGGETGPSAR